MIDIEIELEVKRLRENDFGAELSGILEYWQSHLSSPALDDIQANDTHIAFLSLLRQSYDEIYKQIKTQLENQMKLVYQQHHGTTSIPDFSEKIKLKNLNLAELEDRMHWKLNYEFKPELEQEEPILIDVVMHGWTYYFMELNH